LVVGAELLPAVDMRQQTVPKIYRLKVQEKVNCDLGVPVGNAASNEFPSDDP
jgi:hypothetical protein